MSESASRLSVASRLLAAALGGYALSSVIAVCLALVLPATRAEAVLTGTMASFAIYVCAVLWAFSASSAGRAWMGLSLAAVVPGGAVLISRLAAQ